MIRVAAVGDLHLNADSRGRMRDRWAELNDCADVFLLAGDLTTHGEVDQIRVLVDELALVEIPVVAVLGNHDYHTDHEESLREELSLSGVRVLEGSSTVVELNGQSVGIAGTKGFGGGFPGACASVFGEPEMKAFVQHTQEMASLLGENLRAMSTDYRVALLHYSPVEETLHGERLEIFPFLGSYLLAEAIDEAGADLVVHGHAHMGREKGHTRAGIPVRNVAWPVLKQPFAVYHLESHQPAHHEPELTGQAHES